MNNVTRTIFYNTAYFAIPKCKECIYFIPRGPKFTDNLALTDKCKLFADSAKNARTSELKCGLKGKYYEESWYPLNYE